MKRNSLAKSELQFLGVVSALVLLLGVPMILSFSPSKSSANIRTTASETEKDEPGSSHRYPASAPSAPASTSLLDVRCKQTETSHVVTSAYVRLSGLPCPGVTEMKIINVTNGFSASVIFAANGRYSTDFIGLQEGDNELLLSSLSEEGGENQVKLHIQRHSPIREASISRQ